MPLFEVRSYQGADRPVGKTLTISARDALEAAEVACREPLSDRGPPARLRAVVESAGAPAQRFYARSEG